MPAPVEVQGKQMLVFQDPDRIVEETILVPAEAALFLQFFDGQSSIRDIQTEIMNQTGQLVDSGIIEDLVGQLDEKLLMDSPRFHQHVRGLNEQWAKAPARPAYHAGQGYPAERGELSAMLDGFYLSEKGPGSLPGEPKGDNLKAIVAPHMDIAVAGPATAKAFKALAENTEAELFVIFGTAHNEPQRMFVLTDKDFETPLGTARADKDVISRVAKLRSDRNPLNDYVHKQEHSIEFMVLFLQHALKDRDFKILPVLVAGMVPSVIAGMPPDQDPVFKDFINALAAALDESGKKVCYIAGADLAHRGPRYGDKETWAPLRMKEEEDMDKALLGRVAAADRDGFFGLIAKDGDQRRICGLPPIYAAMAACGPEKGELLQWDYWNDKSTHSIVTYASMALY